MTWLGLRRSLSNLRPVGNGGIALRRFARSDRRQHGRTRGCCCDRRHFEIIRSGFLLPTPLWLGEATVGSRNDHCRASFPVVATPENSCTLLAEPQAVHGAIKPVSPLLAQFI